MGVDMDPMWLYGTNTRPCGGHIPMLSGWWPNDRFSSAHHM